MGHVEVVESTGKVGCSERAVEERLGMEVKGYKRDTTLG